MEYKFVFHQMRLFNQLSMHHQDIFQMTEKYMWKDHSTKCTLQLHKILNIFQTATNTQKNS